MAENSEPNQSEFTSLSVYKNGKFRTTLFLQIKDNLLQSSLKRLLRWEDRRGEAAPDAAAAALVEEEEGEEEEADRETT